MRELHVVAVSEDGRHVVLATRKGALKGEFRVPLDERLSAAVRGDLPRPGEAAPAVVTPKEIQARLRAGESPEEIAASAGVPVSKIERYAGPVLSERERVISQARAGFITRSRLGESALPLGEAVDRHLAETNGVRLETVSWSARREDSGTWLVELSYVSQARRRAAVWRYDGVRREVTALDSLAAALAHVEAGRRSRTSEAEPFSAPAARTVARPAARKAAPVRAPKASKAAKAAKAPAARSVAPRPAAPPVRAAAPVPRAAAPTRAAETAAARAAAAKAARVTTARAQAQERAAKAAAAESARAAEQAQEAADVQARAAEVRTQKATADRAAKAAAAKAAKAAAAKQKAAAAAEEKAAARKAAKERAAQERADKAAADKAAADKAAADTAAKAAEAAAREAEQAPVGPPTLRVVGGEDAPAPARRGPKEPPAAARTAPARVAGQRASVPGWADVLLSTAPVARPEAEPDAD